MTNYILSDRIKSEQLEVLNCDKFVCSFILIYLS